MKSISSNPPLNRCIQMIGIMLLFLLYYIVHRKVLLYGRVLRRKKKYMKLPTTIIILYYITDCAHTPNTISLTLLLMPVTM